MYRVTAEKSRHSFVSLYDCFHIRLRPVCAFEKEVILALAAAWKTIVVTAGENGT